MSCLIVEKSIYCKPPKCSKRAKVNDTGPLGQGRAYEMHNHVRMTLEKNVVFGRDFLTPNLLI